MSMVFDFNDVSVGIKNFPNGPTEAIVKMAKSDVSQTGNPVLRLEFEIYHPEYGTAILKDNISPKFKSKALAFWAAVNDMTLEELIGTEVDVDPKGLKGAQLILQLGEKVSDFNGKTYKEVVDPFFFPLSRAADLFGEEA